MPFRENEICRPKGIISSLVRYFTEFADYQVAMDRLKDKDDPIMNATEFRAHDSE